MRFDQTAQIQSHIMSGNELIKEVCFLTEAFPGEYIPDLQGKTGGYRKSEINKFAVNCAFSVRKIDKGKCKLTVRKVTENGIC